MRILNHLTTKDEYFGIHFRGLQYIYYVILFGILGLIAHHVATNWFLGPWKEMYIDLFFLPLLVGFTMAAYSWGSLKFLDYLLRCRQVLQFKVKWIGVLVTFLATLIFSFDAIYVAENILMATPEEVNIALVVVVVPNLAIFGLFAAFLIIVDMIIDSVKNRKARTT